MTDRLYRHPTDRAIAGVAGGMAAWLNIDPSLVRIGWVLLAIFSGGIFVLVYIVMMIVVPLAPPGWTPRAGGGPGAYPGQGTYPGQAVDPGAWGPAPTTAPPPPDWTGTGGTPDQATSSGGWPATGPTPAPGEPWPAPKGVNAGNAGIVVGVVLVVLGIWFLVDQFVEIDWDLLWPVIIMVLGGALIAAALMRNRAS